MRCLYVGQQQGFCYQPNKTWDDSDSSELSKAINPPNVWSRHSRLELLFPLISSKHTVMYVSTRT